MTYTLWADCDKIVASASRSELRGYFRNADFKAWANQAGYTDLMVCVDGAEHSVLGDYVKIDGFVLDDYIKIDGFGV